MNISQANINSDSIVSTCLVDLSCSCSGIDLRYCASTYAEHPNIRWLLTISGLISCFEIFFVILTLSGSRVQNRMGAGLPRRPLRVGVDERDSDENSK
jgi:hypothetical protein